MDGAQYKALIVSTVGDAGGSIADLIDSLWEANAGQATGGLHRQYLYTFRSAIIVLMGQERRRVTFQTSGDLTVNLSDLMKNLQLMLDAVNDEISGMDNADQGRSDGAVGQLLQTAPVMNPYPGYGPDANDRAYRGDPYRHTRRVQ